MKLDLEHVAAIIRDVAQSEIGPRFGRLRDGDIDTKSGPQDFVTEADRAAEAALRRALPALVAGSGFIGEEGVAAGLDDVRALSGEGVFWVVDPLDGTRNFVRKRSEFGTIVALVKDGETVAGWIYAIPDDAIAMGEKGGGAQWNGAPLTQVGEANGPLKGFRAIGNLEEPHKSRLVPRLREHFVTEPAHCSAYGYIQLLRGEKDFSLYSRCAPWDHAAGALMAEEIGGRAAYLDTDARYVPAMEQGRPMLVSGGAKRWRAVSRALTGDEKSPVGDL